MDNLHSTSSDPLTQLQKLEYEEIDELICKLMDRAENFFWKLCAGKIAWSPTYKKVMQTLEYWQMRRRYKLGIQKNVRQLIVLQN